MNRPLAIVGSAIALLLALAAAAYAGKAPGKPETPFAIRVFAKGDAAALSNAERSAENVRNVIRFKKKDWLRLTDDANEAELSIEIAGEEWSPQRGHVIKGQLVAFDVLSGEIIGQHLPVGGISSTKPWWIAAENMAGRIQRFCKDTYPQLVEARQKRKAAVTP